MLNLITSKPEVHEIQGARFFVRKPSWAETKRVSDAILASKSAPDDPFKKIKPVLSVYLVGWEGVGENGKEVPFSPELVDKLPYDVAYELACRCGIIERPVSGALGAAPSKKKSKKK